MSRLRDRPSYRLTHHFFNSLFDFGVLSETGVDAFKRMIMGIGAAVLAFGLLLLRMYVGKYAALLSEPTPTPYLVAQLADHAVLMALPMWLVAIATVLVSHALFPDETDFRILMAMPVSRGLVFGSKVAALALFTTIFVGFAQVALLPLVLLVTVSSVTTPAWPIALIAFLGASLAASAFAVLAVIAVQGALVMLVPRDRVLAVSSAVRSAMLCALVLALPFVIRLPMTGDALAAGASWLLFAPPMWFVGLERLALGDGRSHLVMLGYIAVFALAGAGAVGTAFYALLYRRFDRVMLRPGGQLTDTARGAVARRRSPADLRRPVLVAVRHFVMVTFRRSVVHQGIMVGLAALGAGLVVNSFLVFGLSAVIGASFVLIFATGLAVRTAISVPLELRANWMFRVTEQDTFRVDTLGAATSALWWLGVVAPVVALAPLHVMAFGARSVVGLSLTAVWGWLYIEVLLRDWVRIPFTCSYLPGKRFVPQLLLISLFSFILFIGTGSSAVRVGLESPLRGVIAGGAAATLAGLARRRRLQLWRETPIQFEDSLPTEINGLKLS